MVAYTLFHNVSPEKSFFDGYRAGDSLVRGFEGVVDLSGSFTIGKVDALAEVVFFRHNADDRPDAKTAPSISVGDIIAFGEYAVTVLPIGFSQVAVDSDDILDISFLEYIKSTQC